MSTDAPRWLDDRERRAWLSFITASHLLDGALDRQLSRDANMPHAYYMILAMLSEAPDRTLRMSALAERTSSSQSRISHAIARLEEVGWVRREKCPTDRRGNLAVLTPAGYETLASAAPGHVEAVRGYLFDVLEPEQVDQLAAICEAMLSRLDPDGALRAGARQAPESSEQPVESR
jgi:DNA-binding MarR family transcriptional regulator